MSTYKAICGKTPFEKQLMKITRAEFGLGGYQGNQFGLRVDFQTDGCGVGAWITGGWDYQSIKPDKYTKWTEEDRNGTMAKMCKVISEILKDAKVDSVSGLKGKPVEVIISNNELKSWRILTEVL